MASIEGIRSIGIDLNPAMKVIAMAKQSTVEDIESIRQKIKKIRSNIKVEHVKNDPLTIWLDDESALLIRKIEKVILCGRYYNNTQEKVDSLQPYQCLMYTALFNTVRQFLKPFIPSNPTWIKRPKSADKKLTLYWPELRSLYVSNLSKMFNSIDMVRHDRKCPLAQINIGSSTNLQLGTESVDLVLTSPPYCTRIDYGVATMPELSIIATNGKSEIKHIRRSLMGTTTVPKSIDTIPSNLGKECQTFLRNVYKHPSKASQTYYFKNLLQYFKSLQLSLEQIYRVIKPNGRFICVVQDSYYKDVHCNLPKIIGQMSQNHGFIIEDVVEFESRQNMANLNQKSKLYRAKNTAYETVIVFKKD
ncbi:DNA methyltransferase [Pseudoalteromonas sp. HM-SA03]|uniref:DNA methyltransferase n=1 Tax=Pseudoalteromonas sp. HM-SA03 TaxID=2029678 RepID=UPI001140F0E1|nr:DNA methyltransferase [Pseudoalteromonas sp. HM-SA03]